MWQRSWRACGPGSRRDGSDVLFLILKALHIIAVVAWMAGLLYLPRLLVYHADAAPGGELSETLKVMERRLLKAITTPAMIAVWLLGIGLMIELGAHRLMGYGWLWVKLAGVLGLSAVHGVLAAHVRKFAADANHKSANYFRILNEVPTVLLIVIVLMVVLQPF